MAEVIRRSSRRAKKTNFSYSVGDLVEVSDAVLLGPFVIEVVTNWAPTHSNGPLRTNTRDYLYITAYS